MLIKNENMEIIYAVLGSIGLVAVGILLLFLAAPKERRIEGYQPTEDNLKYPPPKGD